MRFRRVIPATNVGNGGGQWRSSMEGPRRSTSEAAAETTSRDGTMFLERGKTDDKSRAYVSSRYYFFLYEKNSSTLRSRNLLHARIHTRIFIYLCSRRTHTHTRETAIRARHIHGRARTHTLRVMIRNGCGHDEKRKKKTNNNNTTFPFHAFHDTAPSAAKRRHRRCPVSNIRFLPLSAHVSFRCLLSRVYTRIVGTWPSY